MKHFAPSKVKDSWIINEGIQPLSEDGFHYEFEVRDLRFGINDIEVMMEVATLGADGVIEGLLSGLSMARRG